MQHQPEPLVTVILPTHNPAPFIAQAIKSVLMQQSERLRVERKQMIQAKAAKAPVKIMIPTVIFIFPVVFIILLGPAVVSLIQTFG